MSCKRADGSSVHVYDAPPLMHPRVQEGGEKKGKWAYLGRDSNAGARTAKSQRLTMSSYVADANCFMLEAETGV